jgi:hypothetical protein
MLVKGGDVPMKTARLIVLLALAMAVNLAAVSDAMPQFGGGMPGAGAKGGRMGKGAPAERSSRPERQSVADLVAFRLELLQDSLKLARDQETAWAAYEKRTMALAADIEREQNRLRSAMSMSAMQQLDHAVDTARDRLTAWEDVSIAAKTLYASLTSQQKDLADARFPSIVNALVAGGMPTYTQIDGKGDRPPPSR